MGAQIYQNSLGHMTAIMPIYGKNLLKPSLELNGLIETWYTASDTPVLPSLFK